MATAAELEPQQLTNVLRRAGVLGTQSVVDVTRRQVGSGQMGACYALELSFDAESPSAPQRLVAKVPSADAGSQAFATANGAYAREVSFYRDVAGSLPVRTPRCYAAEVNDDGSDFLLLLEDLSPATECGQLEGCNVDRAALALEQAAALHAGSWRDPRLQKWPGCTTVSTCRGNWPPRPGRSAKRSSIATPRAWTMSPSKSP